MKNRLMKRIKSHAHEMHVKLNVSTEVEMLEKLICTAGSYYIIITL